MNDIQALTLTVALTGVAITICLAKIAKVIQGK